MQIQANFVTFAELQPHASKGPAKSGSSPPSFGALFADMLEKPHVLSDEIMSVLDISLSENGFFSELGAVSCDSENIAGEEMQGSLHLDSAVSAELGTASMDGENKADNPQVALHLDSAVSAELGAASVDGENKVDNPQVALHLDSDVSTELEAESTDEEYETNDLQAGLHLVSSLTMEMQAAPKETANNVQPEVVPIDYQARLEGAKSQSRNFAVQEAAVGEEGEEFVGYHNHKAAEKLSEAGKGPKQFPPIEEWDIRAEEPRQFKFRAEQMKSFEGREAAEWLVTEKAVFPTGAALETSAGIYGKVNVERAAVLDQVLKKMVINKDVNGESKVFIRLKPAVLGEVEIRLRMENGQLSGSILTQNAQVKEVLETALAQLKQRLEAQQIQVAELTVTVGQEQDFHQGRGFTKMTREQSVASNIDALTADADEMPLATVMLQGLIDARA